MLILSTASLAEGSFGQKQPDSLPAVVRSKKDLRKQVRNNPGMAMIDLKSHVIGIQLHLRYCDTNHFLKKKFYPPLFNTYLRLDAANKLNLVQKELQQMGLGLLVWDAYRPYRVTVAMWELVKDERYAANPKSGSGHNRGIAVDCSIVTLHDGKPLNMGTDFDHFSDTAHHDFAHPDSNVVRNRLLLKSLMEKHGFVALPTEWWHYSLPEPSKYPLLDLPFEALEK